MIKYVKGNILNATEGYICHSVNHQGVLGSGLAKQLADIYPDLKNSNGQYMQMCKTLSYELIKHNGHIAFCGTGKGHQTIVCIFGQEYYGRDKQYTDYVALGNGFEEENYHSMIEVPRKILGILEKHVSDKTVILSIMKSLYDEGLP